MGPYYIDDRHLPHRKLGSIQSWPLGDDRNSGGLLRDGSFPWLQGPPVVTSQATSWCALGCWICKSPLVASSVRAGCCHPWWWSIGLRKGGGFFFGWMLTIGPRLESLIIFGSQKWPCLKYYGSEVYLFISLICCLFDTWMNTSWPWYAWEILPVFQLHGLYLVGPKFQRKKPHLWESLLAIKLQPWPPRLGLVRLLAPFRLINAYGVFPPEALPQARQLVS